MRSEKKKKERVSVVVSVVVLSLEKSAYMLFSSLSSLCFDRSMMRRSFSSSPHASISTSRFNNVFRRGENERFPPPRVCSAKATASVSSSKGRESKKKNAIIKKGVGLKVSSFRCASSSSSSESSSFEAGGGGGGKEGKNTSASPKEEEKEEENNESSGLEKAGFVLDKENNEDHLVKVVVDRVKSIEEQEDFSLDWAPVVLRALDGSDRVLPLFSGNKKNQILEVLFHEMKKGKKESESNETITYHAWEGRIHAGFENAEAVVVCERGDELDEDETTGENLTISSMFENILKEAVELSRVDWETLAKWQDITKEEEKRGPTRSARHPSSSSSNSKFSIKIVDSDGAINTRDWQILKSILRKDILPQSQKTFDLPNDSEVLLSLLVTLVKNLPIYATRQVLEKYSKSHEWGLSYRRGHSAPKPNVKRRIIFTDDLPEELVDLSDGLYRKHGDNALFFIMETFKSYDRMLKHSQDAKNSPKKKRQGGPMYRRDMDQLILKRLEVALFIQQQSARFMEDGNLEDDFLTALYQHPRLQKLQDEINEILSLEKRDCDAAKKIIDLEVAVQREDYETAATLRESLRLLNNITWVYLRGDQQNPFDG